MDHLLKKVETREALEEIGIKGDSPFYMDAVKIAKQQAMDKFLSMCQ